MLSMKLLQIIDNVRGETVITNAFDFDRAKFTDTLDLGSLYLYPKAEEFRSLVAVETRPREREREKERERERERENGFESVTSSLSRSP